MRARYSLLALLLAVSTASSAYAQSPDQTAPQAQQQPAPTASPNTPTPNAVPVSQSQPVPAPAAPKHHKVFTNDDFDALPHEANVNGGRDLLEQVNSCDRACFDQVSRALGTYSFDARAKQSLLNAVDKSKEDLPWQGLLGEAIAIQAQSCELQMKKKQDLDRFADPRTVTHKELMVDREYEPKFREMTRRLNDASARANARIDQITDPFQAQFMRVQLSRVVNATCHIYVTETPQRRDPEDADPPESNEPSSDDDSQ
jgi:hypothetical protein